jgi:hypothetical protein
MSEQPINNERPFLVQNKINKDHQQHGWLSREGAFIVCDPDKHGACAKWIYELNKKYFEDKFGPEVNGLDPRTILGKAGYIKIAGPYPDFYNLTNGLNSRQYEKLREAGYKIPKDLDLDPTNLLPQKEEIIKELSNNYPIKELEECLNYFYKDPFSGFRTENLEMGKQIFDVLSKSSTEEKKYQSSENWGVQKIISRKLGDGKIALAYELYQHRGESPKDFGAAEKNVTVYVNTPEYIEGVIPDESKIKPEL